jgi:hypothetical protein
VTESSGVHPSRASKAQLSRRTLLAAGAWSAPVVALAVAAPSAAASGDEPVFITADATAFGTDAAYLAFPVQMQNIPELPASEWGDLVGLSFDLCLPPGLRIVSVDAGWDFFQNDEGSDPFEGGDAYVFNTTAFTAGSGTGTATTIQIIVERSPDHVGINGVLGSDVSIGSTGFFTEIEWNYVYDSTPVGAPLPNCAKSF